MKRIRIYCLLLFIVACSQNKEPYSPLSKQELKTLQTYEVNHSFIAGCVAEKLAKINRDYCDEESLFCNIPPESTLSYQQWLSVYHICTDF